MQLRPWFLPLLACNTFFFINPSPANEVSHEEFERLRIKVASLAGKVEKNQHSQTNIDFSGFASAGFISQKSDDNTGSFTGAEFSPAITYNVDNTVAITAEVHIAREGDGQTATTLEHATIHVNITHWLQLIAGQFLSPFGQFRQQFYSSYANQLPTAPAGFRRDDPIPLSETGIQLKGHSKIKSTEMHYAIYFGNGPELKIKTNNTNDPINPLTLGIAIDTIENQAFGRDLNNGKTWGSRLGLLPLADLELGFSIISGEADAEFDIFTGTSLTQTVSGNTDMLAVGFDFSLPYQYGILRGEYINQEIDALSIEAINGLKTENAVWQAYYLQGSYGFKQKPWEMVIRYTNFKSANKFNSQIQRALGINYKLHKNTVIKLAYSFNSSHSSATAGNTTLVQLAYGL